MVILQPNLARPHRPNIHLTIKTKFCIIAGILLHFEQFLGASYLNATRIERSDN